MLGLTVHLARLMTQTFYLNFQTNSNPYQMVHNSNVAGTSQRKRTRRKRSSKPSNPPITSTKQPSMGLASLRQHHISTLRRSEECLNSTPDSSTSSPEESTSDPENRDPPNPIWTRRAGPPPADTDTLPSSEDEYPPSQNPESPVHQRIFVKDSNGAFIGVTPNQLHHLKYSTQRNSPPQETRRKNR